MTKGETMATQNDNLHIRLPVESLNNLRWQAGRRGMTTSAHLRDLIGMWGRIQKKRDSEVRQPSNLLVLPDDGSGGKPAEG